MSLNILTPNKSGYQYIIFLISPQKHMFCVPYLVLWNTMQYNAIQYNTIQCTTIQYNAIQYNTIQYNTTQHNTIQELNVLITKTCLYRFDPLKPHFYIVKLGFTGVCIIFLISAQKHSGYSLEPPRRGGSNGYPESMFWAERWKLSEFLSENFQFFWWWNFLYIWIGVFS